MDTMLAHTQPLANTLFLGIQGRERWKPLEHSLKLTGGTRYSSPFGDGFKFACYANMENPAMMSKVQVVTNKQITRTKGAELLKTGEPRVPAGHYNEANLGDSLHLC